MRALRRPQRGALTDLRSWGLLVGAGICGTRVIVYGFSNEPLPSVLRTVADVMPAWIYVALWAATAATLAIAAVWQVPARRWHGLVVGMPLLWGSFYATGAVLGGMGVATGPDADFVRGFGNAWLWWFIGIRFGITLLMAPGVSRLHRRDENTGKGGQGG